MNREDFQKALFAIGRDRDEVLHQRDLLIVQMARDRRAHNIQEEVIYDEINREVEGTGKIGELSGRIKEFEIKVNDLYYKRYADALADNGRRLTAEGLTEAVFAVLRASGRDITMDGVEAGLAAKGFDMDTLENPSGAIASALEELVGSGRIRFLPETSSYGLTLNELMRLLNEQTAAGSPELSSSRARVARSSSAFFSARIKD